MAASPDAFRPRRPRLLVTGFGPFPGVPVNPTEALVEELAAQKERFAHLCDLRTEVFPVDYRALPGRLEDIGTGFGPDIAIHFGLSLRATGIQLERKARNVIAEGKPDDTGHIPQSRHIRADAGDVDSSLPLEEISDALQAEGLPVGFSDDAGAYLCNYLFYLSGAHFCTGFAPSMSGFIHMPPSAVLGIEEMASAASTIVDVCCRAWCRQAVLSD